LSVLALLACAAAFYQPTNHTCFAQETAETSADAPSVTPPSHADVWREAHVRGKIFGECSRNVRQILHGWNEYPTATIDWARINEMPAWLVVRPERDYSVQFDDGEATTIAGRALNKGIEIAVGAGQTRRIGVWRR
jgi:hypothetical protein